MMKQIQNLKLDGSNVDKVDSLFNGDFYKAFLEFESINTEDVALMDEDEAQADQHGWWEPRVTPLRGFVDDTEDWYAAMKKKVSDKSKADQDDVKPEDSVSQAGTDRRSQKTSSVASADSGTLAALID